MERYIKFLEWEESILWKLLDLISENSKVAGYKINTQELFVFLYTNNEKSERGIKETIPFTIAMEKIKHLRINIPKETKDLSIENYKTLMKEIKDDTKRWTNIPCSWLEESIQWKWVYYPKQSIHS